jgi:hypothetical protein
MIMSSPLDPAHFAKSSRPPAEIAADILNFPLYKSEKGLKESRKSDPGLEYLQFGNYLASTIEISRNMDNLHHQKNLPEENPEVMVQNSVVAYEKLLGSLRKMGAGTLVNKMVIQKSLLLTELMAKELDKAALREKENGSPPGVQTLLVTLAVNLRNHITPLFRELAAALYIKLEEGRAHGN